MGSIISACLTRVINMRCYFPILVTLKIYHYYYFFVLHITVSKSSLGVSVSSKGVIFQSGLVKCVEKLTSLGSVEITIGISSIQG